VDNGGAAAIKERTDDDDEQVRLCVAACKPTHAAKEE